MTDQVFGMQMPALADLHKELLIRKLDPTSRHLVPDLVYSIKQQVRQEDRKNIQEIVNYELAKLGIGGRV